MKCSFCGYEFSEKSGKEACKGCIIRGCGMVKCPNCNYENPIEPSSLKSIVRRIRRWKKLKKKY